jgi:hypothetical protein
MSGNNQFVPGYYNQTQAYVKAQPSAALPTKEYFYTVTGEAILGDNKKYKEFAPSRFKINEQLQNRTQSEGWEEPMKKATPYFDISKPLAAFPVKYLSK